MLLVDALKTVGFGGRGILPKWQPEKSREDEKGQNIHCSQPFPNDATLDKKRTVLVIEQQLQ